ACFDRVVPNVSALANARYGVPKKASILMNKMLHAAQYHIKTADGMTNAFNTFVLLSSFDNLQGGTSSAWEWVFICCVLLDIHD
ncbi:MAG: hypothetical protein AAGJ35_13940, partial [Myxococcota bacterium]